MTRAIRLILLAAVMLAVPAVSFGAVAVSITIAPPLLPVYAQPICPGAGYIWTPGYWAYGPYGYYWVPGTWVMSPFIGALWTPGYWGWGSGVYVWHQGFWGPHVGFYGGINYGFGYMGVGYAGGYWNHGSFFYNSAVNNVNRTVVRNVYSSTVINNSTANRVSYNGGTGGTTPRPTAAETAAARDRRSGPTTAQTRLRQSASTNHAQLASVNHGRPSVLATARPAEFPAHQTAPANRLARNNVHTNSQTRRTGNSAAGARRVASSAHANRQPSNHPAVSRITPRSSHYKAGNNAASRPAASHNHALAQHSAPRRTAAARHSAPPSSHYSARNIETLPRHAAAQPHYSGPAQRSTPARHSAPPPSHYSARNIEAPPRHTAAQPH